MDANPDNTNLKTLGAAGAVGTVLSYIAQIVQVKYGVPIEVTSIVLGGAFGVISKWASNLPASPPREPPAGPHPLP